jgi:hypothetical protein
VGKAKPARSEMKPKSVDDREGSRADLTALNFKVPQAFHREFKTYAAQHGLSMLELLKTGFDLVKRNRPTK